MSSVDDVGPFEGLKTREDVAEWLGTSASQLKYLLHGRAATQRYTEFTIAKRRGGERTILAPRDDLKILQRKLSEQLARMYVPRDVAYAFVEGRNIRDNAEQHVRCRHVLNVDLKDFFPSVNFGRVRGLFMSLGATPGAATILAQICCHHNVLPQGAPTSPVVSNMICARMDRELLALAKKYHCRYTRYADDLTFSRRGGTFPVELARREHQRGETVLGPELRTIIERNGFKPHPEKTRLFDGQARQVVTGLVVNSKRNVRREWVRELRAMIHAWRTFGLECAEADFHARCVAIHGLARQPPPFAQVIRGKMEFLKMIKGPQDPVYRRLQQRLLEVDESYFLVMQKENALLNKRDVFISHASEDKQAVAKALADRLIVEGISVWYDEYCIQLGDDILMKIDEGLANSKFGVIILSKNFFAAKKTWTMREYSALVAGVDIDSARRMIPVWHEINREELFERSPTIVNCSPPK
jgi:RNA-directed DNA polymerase